MRTTSAVIHAILQLPCGMHHRWTTVAECERLKLRGECTRVRQAGGKSIGRTRPVYRLIAQAQPSQSVPTASALTFKDTLIAVGIDPMPHREYGLSHLRVGEVRSKIRAYGESSPRQALA